MTSATTIDSSTVVVPARPTGSLTIAGRTYKLRCPKLKGWMTVLEHQKQSRALQALEPQLERIYTRFIDLNNAGVVEGDEVTQLLTQLGVLQEACKQSPNSLQLSDIFLEFLGACMLDKRDTERLIASYNTADGDVDMPHLVLAIEQLNDLFADWLNDQADFVGVETPEPERLANRAVRRAADKQPVKVGTRTTTKRATTKRTEPRAR